MTHIKDTIPDIDVLLALTPGEVAPAVLSVASRSLQNGIVHFSNMTLTYDAGRFSPTANPPNPPNLQSQVTKAVREAWQWLVLNLLLMPAEGTNGNSGFMVLTRKGEELANGGDFKAYREAASFPNALLHPSIADKVWLELARGDLPDAVFYAFRNVEEAVREAGGFGFGRKDLGNNLMRNAFDVNTGPLTDMFQPEAEREALAHLFAGAIGSYKNSHSPPDRHHGRPTGGAGVGYAR